VPLAVLLADVLRNGGVLSGSDGMFAGADQQLYLAAVRDSGTDVLISNEFRLGASDGVYFQPQFAISGLLWRLGLDLRVALLVWKPIAAAMIAAGVWGYVRGRLAGRARVAAALLAIFFFSPVLPLLVWQGTGLAPATRLTFEFLSGESMPALQFWGYLHAALVIGLLPLVLLALERVLDPARRAPGRSRGWYLGWASIGGLVIGWLHPWQGATLLAIIGGVAAWGRFRPGFRILLLPALATAAPMVYEFLLSRLDADWISFSQQNTAPHAPLWMLLAALLPLALPALLAVRPNVDEVGERILLLWPPAALGVYLLTAQFPYHALQGISIPLAVLATRGFARLRLPALAGAACVAVLTIPGIVHVSENLSASIDSDVAPYVLDDGENAALEYLANAPVEGGVLARTYLGGSVPARTGRDTWVGHFTWTPDFNRRAAIAEDLLAGRLGRGQARDLVASIKPAYLLADCGQTTDLAQLLGPLVGPVESFGCASVYPVAADLGPG
jgi:hypothetical protein